MSMLRRPELEKDNPVAPQIYVGPRRKRAMARKASSEPTAPDGITTRLQRLVDAAEQFVNSMPPVQETDNERTALLEAISHAQGCLSIEDSLVTRSRRGSKKR
jgi:hypothetical protein